MYTKAIHIVHGLPGSGKSTYLHKMKKTMEEEHDRYNDPFLNICNIDNTPDKNIINAAISELKKLGWSDEHANINAFDGLFDTNDICKIILACADYYVSEYDHDLWEENKLNLKVTVLHWNEDREQCIENDKARNRSLLCTRTIQTMEFCNSIKDIEDDITSYVKDGIHTDYKEYSSYLKNNINKILELVEFTIDIQTFDVPVFDEYFYIAQAGNSEGIIKSERWCVGGQVGNCWNNHMCAASADEAPKYFKELVEVLSSYNENFKMTDYLYILDNFVRIGEKTEHEYYGSYYDYNWYECNVQDIINYLQTKNN